MLFEIQDEGRSLLVTAENLDECRELVKHADLDPFTYAAQAVNGRLQHKLKSTRRDNGGWFQETANLGPEWLAPYMKNLQAWFGYTGPIPTIDPAPCHKHDWKLCVTHMVEHAMIHPGGFYARGYVESQDWDGKTAAQRAGPYFTEGVQKDLGDQRCEPEYIPANEWGTLMKRNPKWMTYHKPHPAAKNERIMTALVRWWVDNAATPGQKACLEEALATHRSVCKNDDYGGWLGRSYGGVHRTWENHVTWEQFRSL